MTKSHWFSGLLLAFSMSASSLTEAGFFNLSYTPDVTEVSTPRVNVSSDLLYGNMNLQAFHLSREAFDLAVAGYNKLMNEEKVANSRYLTVIDFSKALDEKRFYLIDLEKQEVALHTYVMHGKKSGGEIAKRFSNRINSFQSSLGFYVTRNTYTGKRGKSLRLEGLEEGFNSNALERNIVLHGSNYISASRARRGKVERSEGCPAIPMQEVSDVIRKVRDGSVLFIYHPSSNYLANSPVLRNTFLENSF